jgi:hypothetical protein
MKPGLLALALIAVIWASWDWIPFDYLASKVDVQQALFWFRR